MEGTWNAPKLMREFFPFEVAMTRALYGIAVQHLPFGAEDAMMELRRPLVNSLHSTLPINCERTGCTLCGTEDYRDINTTTGEITPPTGHEGRERQLQDHVHR